MAERREYGSGGIYHNAKRDRWEGTLEHGYNRNGKRRRITVTGKTEAEVKRRLRDKKLALKQGQQVAASRVTVKAFAEKWLDLRVTKRKPKTYSTDKGAVEKWIVPTIGHVRLDQLTVDDVRAVSAACRKAGLSSSTSLRYQATLGKMLKQAALEGLPVPSNVLVVERPTKAVHDRQALSVREAVTLLSAAEQMPGGASRWAAALLQGMRQGECLGLTWDAVNLSAEIPHIVVDWQLQALPYLDPANKALGFRIPDGFETRHLDRAYHLIRPKSRAGRRVIPLAPWMATSMRDWWETGTESRHGLVWPRVTGAPQNPKADRDAWESLQAACAVSHPNGRPYYLHEARHATATILRNLGVPESVRIAIMGHSDIKTTQGYESEDLAESFKAMSGVAGLLGLGR